LEVLSFQVGDYVIALHGTIYGFTRSNVVCRVRSVESNGNMAVDVVGSVNWKYTLNEWSKLVVPMEDFKLATEKEVKLAMINYV